MVWRTFRGILTRRDIKELSVILEMFYIFLWVVFIWHTYKDKVKKETGSNC